MSTQPGGSFDVDLSMTGQLGNRLLGELNKLRELDGIHWSEATGGWLITRHADVEDALQGKFPLSLRRVERIIFGPLPAEERAQLPQLQRFIPHWPIEMDPPEHTRLRKLLVKAFSKKVVDAQRPFVQARVEMLMRKLEQQPQLEFNEQIARQLPGSVILKLFGLPQEHLERLKEWANAFQEGIGVPFADMAAKRRAENRHGGDDRAVRAGDRQAAPPARPGRPDLVIARGDGGGRHAYRRRDARCAAARADCGTRHHECNPDAWAWLRSRGILTSGTTCTGTRRSCSRALSS